MSERAVAQGRRDFLKTGAALGGAAAVGLGGAMPGTAAAAAATALPLPDYEQWDATEIALRIRRGDVKPSEVLEAAIARAEAYAAINAVTVPHFDMARERRARSTAPLRPSARRVRYCPVCRSR
ncbi:twin-arginine translocation signal domain-containing protein [Thauera humireducens]|uniref:twin-arginine translocation signal domain-containing protein n=1 Tax=Thauera humireducens TaxID=1134435 RepID=UPI00311D33B6